MPFGPPDNGSGCHGAMWHQGELRIAALRLRGPQRLALYQREGGLVAPVLTYFAAGQATGFTIPMLISTTGAAIVFVLTLLYSPETKGKVLVPEITLTHQPAE